MSGTVTITVTNKRKVEIDWIADSGNAAVPDTDFAASAVVDLCGKYCSFAVTDPGYPAPTDEYDIEILDEYGIDVFGGELNNRSATNAEQAVPKIGNGYGSRLCAGTWTFSLSGNSVNSAQGKCILYFEP